ncbi:uncharacterized protein [Paramormyrops kingsleyae]|uniref:uncharacterized protein n=1 Tax=Paramormyrops kingsleyae TaxID=1676925 RepID=UPI003B97371A
MEAVIRSALPMLDKDQLNDLTSELRRIGVKTDDDLQYVTLDDVKDFLSPIDCRKLINFFKSRGNENVLATPNPSTFTVQCHGSSSVTSQSPTFIPVPVQSATWLSDFQIPWGKMTPNLQTCLAQGKRPEASDRRHMVRVIVDSIREVCLNPSKQQCSQIAQSVIQKYPHSFSDKTEEGELIGCGYYSLLCQLKTRVEHLNRNNTMARLRKPKRTEGEMDDSQPSTSKSAKLDSYGCVNWNPAEFPEGEHLESLELKRNEMLSLFSQEGPRAAERNKVQELMKLTFVAQRHSINASPPSSISDLQARWPFLFMKRFLCAHFKELTGIDLDLRLKESLCTKGERILCFFKNQSSRWGKEVRTVLREIDREGRDVDQGLAAVLLMMAHFKEKEESLFLSADVTTTPADAETRLSLPYAPRLIMLGGSVLCSKKWMLSVEGKVFIPESDLPDLSSAFAVLFGSYYVLNLEYQVEAATTLEFIQRFFVRINPDNSKCSSRFQVSKRSGRIVQRKNSGLNPHVSSFIKEFLDFSWQNY